MSKESLHNKHRERMRERFLKDGFGNFQEHEILEMLLFYCISRRNTNDIAHNLIKRFGSLSQVIDAPVKELEKVEGIGAHSALFLNLLGSFRSYCGIKKANTSLILKTLDQCGEYMVPYFQGRNRETVYLLCLDAKCKALSCREVEEGNVNTASISIRKIVDMALTENATSVVLAHNHPSGVALPSAEDILTTKKLAHALRLVDVVLIDHIIVADGDHVSLALSGLYRADDVVVD